MSAIPHFLTNALLKDHSLQVGVESACHGQRSTGTPRNLRSSLDAPAIPSAQYIAAGRCLACKPRPGAQAETVRTLAISFGSSLSPFHSSSHVTLATDAWARSSFGGAVVKNIVEVSGTTAAIGPQGTVDVPTTQAIWGLPRFLNSKRLRLVPITSR